MKDVYDRYLLGFICSKLGKDNFPSWGDTSEQRCGCALGVADGKTYTVPRTMAEVVATVKELLG